MSVSAVHHRPVVAASFDAGAAMRVFRERWLAMVMDAAFGPFAAMVADMERAFLEVPMARKVPKNKAKVFRIRNPERMLTYHAKVKASGPSVVYLQQTLDAVLELVGAAYPEYYADVRDRFVDLLRRWTQALPAKLVGRDEEAILRYVDDMREATEDCAMGMLDCEERMAEVAAKRAAA